MDIFDILNPDILSLIISKLNFYHFILMRNMYERRYNQKFPQHLNRTFVKKPKRCLKYVNRSIRVDNLNNLFTIPHDPNIKEIVLFIFNNTIDNIDNLINNNKQITHMLLFNQPEYTNIDIAKYNKILLNLFPNIKYIDFYTNEIYLNQYISTLQHIKTLEIKYNNDIISRFRVMNLCRDNKHIKKIILNVLLNDKDIQKDIDEINNSVKIFANEFKHIKFILHISNYTAFNKISYDNITFLKYLEYSYIDDKYSDVMDLTNIPNLKTCELSIRRSDFTLNIENCYNLANLYIDINRDNKNIKIILNNLINLSCLCIKCYNENKDFISIEFKGLIINHVIWE